MKKEKYLNKKNLLICLYRLMEAIKEQKKGKISKETIKNLEGWMLHIEALAGNSKVNLMNPYYK